MSALATAVDEYLRTRQALGFKLKFAAPTLRRFVTFLESRSMTRVTTELAVEWACQPAGAPPAHWARRLGVVRRFARYHQASDPQTEIPSADLLPFRWVRKPPYIYTDNDISALIDAARALSGRVRPKTYPTLIALLAATGLRVSEALCLQRRDCDLKEAVLFVRQTKFRKSRLVPLHASTAEALERYSAEISKVFPHATTLLVSPHGKALRYTVVLSNFRFLLRRVGLPPQGDPRRPLPHGLRHTFAVRTLLGWYRAGVNVERELPLLATYLGHTHIAYTYWYLSATPELLRLAAERLEGPLWRMPS